MSDKKLDDIFKQAFGGYSPDVPPHIWENIAAGKKKKRPAAFWLNRKATLLLLLAGFLLAGGAGFFIFTAKESDQHIALENNNGGEQTGSSTPAAVSNDSQLSAAADNDESKTTGARSSLAPVNESRSGSKNNKPVPGNDLAGTNSPALVTSGSPASFNNDLPGAGSDIAGSNKSVKARKRTPHKTRINTKEPETGDTEAENEYSNETAVEFALPLVDGTKNLIQLLAENNLPKQTIRSFTPAFKIPEECPGAPTKKYYIEAYISPDYAIKKYSDTGQSTLVARRKESLRFQSAFSAGMRYTRVFTNGMSVRTGINFSQINEKFSYAQDNVVQIMYVINNQGDTTDSYYVRGTRYKNSYNHFKTVDVPLLIGYEMGNDRLRANINAGAVVNIYSWQQGETLDNNGNPVTITTGKPNNPYQYKTNVGIGFTAGASIYYKLNNRLYAMAEPYFRYNFSPMNKEVLSIQERFTTIGLRFGIRVDIK
jgi:hypothetical protein